MAGLAEKKPLSQEFVDHTMKHVAQLRETRHLADLSRAADHLEGWVHGLLPPEPLLDATAPSG